MLFLGEKHIAPNALLLLRELQSDKRLRDFFLVGGTALAMQLGHRLSIDLDLFTDKPFDTQDLLEHLSAGYNFRATTVFKNTLLGFIEETKVDFVAHQFALVTPLIETEGFRMASLEDIAAMKLNAIVHSGQRLKDFWDIYFLLEKMPLSVMLQHYETKYPASNAMIALKAVSYFDDINHNLDKPRIWRKITFAQLQKRIFQAVQYIDKIFQPQ